MILTIFVNIFLNEQYAERTISLNKLAHLRYFLNNSLKILLNEGTNK